MTNLRKLTILLAIVIAMYIMFAVIDRYQTPNNSLIKVYKSYKEKGKNNQFNTDDVKKAFN